MTKIKIKVTKAILEETKMCGYTEELISTNCAVSVAVRDVFPHAAVAGQYIFPFSGIGNSQDIISTSKKVFKYISRFDRTDYIKRPSLPEIEFEIEISDYILEKLIPLDEIKKLLTNHPTLELIEN